MVQGVITMSRQEGVAIPERIPTAFMVLVALNEAKTPLSTYHIGMMVTDNQIPPRPASKIIKSLSKDNYIYPLAFEGKLRASLWAITEKGLQSLSRRKRLADIARQRLSQNQNLSNVERQVLSALNLRDGQIASEIIVTVGIKGSPVRTALKRLSLRNLIYKDPSTRKYMLTR